MSASLNEPDSGTRYTRSNCKPRLRAALNMRQTRWFLLLASLYWAACGNDDSGTAEPKCLEPLPACEPGIDPTFSQIYKQILVQRCGGLDSGSSCHGKSGLKGGLGLLSEDEAYDALLGKGGQRARVKPNDAECSILMQRVNSTDRAFRMPRNEDPLSDGFRCAIQLWIQSGAEP